MLSNFQKKTSLIQGLGIFSLKKIKKNDIIYSIPLNKVYDKPKEKCAKISDNQWVDDEKFLNYINHSCDPNSELVLDKKPYIRSLRDISSNEEITVDYNNTERRDKKIKCNCKSKNCKGYFYISA